MTTTTTRTADVTVSARAKFFACGRIETRKCLVEPDGSVLVWDDVAAHYTRCHSLSSAAARRIANLADRV